MNKTILSKFEWVIVFLALIAAIPWIIGVAAKNTARNIFRIYIALSIFCLSCFGQTFTYTDLPFLASEFGTTPDTIPQLIIWLDAGTGVTSQGGDGTAIWKWNDKSGRTNDVYNVNGSGSTNFTGGPTYHTTGGPNSLPYIDLTPGLLQSDASLGMSQPNTYFAVCRHTFNTTVKFLFDGVTAGSRNAYIDHSASSLYAGLQPNLDHIDVSSFSVVAFIFDGGLSRIRTNGVEITAQSLPPNVGTQAMGRIRIGKAQNNTGPWNGDIVEFIGYNALLTTNQLKIVEAYLKGKYSL